MHHEELSVALEMTFIHTSVPSATSGDIVKEEEKGEQQKEEEEEGEEKRLLWRSIMAGGSPLACESESAAFLFNCERKRNKEE